MAIGLGYRTNPAGAAAVAGLAAREGVAVETYDMAHDQGPAHVLHLQSVISGVTEDLCVIYEPLAPVRMLMDLRERGFDGSRSTAPPTTRSARTSSPSVPAWS